MAPREITPINTPNEQPALGLKLDMAAVKRDDNAFCIGLLPAVSRTFALSIEALPDALRDAVRLSYLLCRIVDTVEDGPAIAFSDRNLLFDGFDEVLGHDNLPVHAFEMLCRKIMGPDVDPAERRLCHGAGAVLRSFRALDADQRRTIRPHVLQMTSGMRSYVRRAHQGGPQRTSQVGSIAELERYCFYVAGTVGNLLTALFIQHIEGLSSQAESELQERAVSFGLGLQMVNIVKDVAADLARTGQCYLPICSTELSRGQLLEPSSRREALEIVHSVCCLARKHLLRAQEYTALWPVPSGLAVRKFCAVPLALALATLNKVERSSDTLKRGQVPKLSREAVSQLARDAEIAAASDTALNELFGGLRHD